MRAHKPVGDPRIILLAGRIPTIYMAHAITYCGMVHLHLMETTHKLINTLLLSSQCVLQIKPLGGLLEYLKFISLSSLTELSHKDCSLPFRIYCTSCFSYSISKYNIFTVITFYGLLTIGTAVRTITCQHAISLTPLACCRGSIQTCLLFLLCIIT